MFCPKCGSQLPDGSKFCAQCGTSMAGVASPSGAGAAGSPGAPGAAPYAPPVTPGPPTFNAPKKSNPAVKLVLLGVAALAVVAAVIFGITRCVGGGGHGSAQDVVNGVNSAFTTMIDNNFSSDSCARAIDGLIDLMPPEAVDAMLEEAGVSRDELREVLSDELLDLDEMSEYLSLVDMTFEASVGAPLDSDDLEYVNEELMDAGVTTQATEAHHIAISMEISALGQTESQNVDESGLVAVNIGGSWYLWGDM